MSLTDEQCNEFRRLPLSFNDMARAIHSAGQRDMRERAAKVLDKRHQIETESANEIRNLEIE